MTDRSPVEASSYRLGRTIAKNTAVVTLGGMALKLVNFVFGVYVVRRLGGDRFGQYSIVLAFVGLFQIFAELGMSQYVMREIARDRSKTGPLFWNLVALRMLLATAGIVGITIAAYGAGYSQALVLGVFIYTWTFILSAIEAPLETVLTANERFDIVTGLTILGQVGFVIIGSFVLVRGWGFLPLIAVGLVAMLPQVGLAAWAVRRNHYLDFPFQITPRLWSGLIRSGLPFGLISLSLTIAFSIDTVMLSKFQPEHVVGWYNVAYGLTRSLTYSLSAFSVVMVPSLSRTYLHDAAQVEHWFYRSIKFIFLASIPIAVGGTLIAFPLIRLLYTSAFLPAAPALQIIIWDVPVLMFASFCGNMTTITGEERAGARIYGLSALANIGLNLYFIPRLGFLGAAFVTVLTDLIAALQFYFLLRRKLHLPNMTSVVVRILAAGVVMGAAVLLVGNRGVPLLIVVGAVVYLGLVLALRLLDTAEWESIRRVLRQLRSRPAPAERG